MRKLLYGLAFLGLLSPLPAYAVECGPTDHLTNLLLTKYQETPRSMGLGPRGNVLAQLFASDSGSWSFVVTYTTGISCIKAHGKSYELLPISEPEHPGM